MIEGLNELFPSVRWWGEDFWDILPFAACETILWIWRRSSLRILVVDEAARNTNA